MIVVVFQPHAAKLFLRKPLSLFQGRNIAIEDMGDRGLTELAHKIADTESHSRCIELIEQFLLHRLVMDTNYKYNIDRLSAAIRHINFTPRLNVSEMADKACLSTKQFTRVFEDYVGTSPKEFMRIVRIQRALYLLQGNPQYKNNLAQLACCCGFADQSHMIREFKQFTGYTPLEYLFFCDPQSDYFVEPS